MGGIYGILYLYGVYAKPRIYFVRSRNLSVALERGNDMKKRLFSLLLVLTLCFTLLPYSAAAEGGEETMVTVAFDMGGHGGAAPASVTVPKGSKITAPESPAPGCEDGKYYFVHWDGAPPFRRLLGRMEFCQRHRGEQHDAARRVVPVRRDARKGLSPRQALCRRPCGVPRQGRAASYIR